MNKSDLIKALSNELNLPEREASSIISTIFESMTEALANGENVEIRGFGSFTVKHYKPYIGRNPKTGAERKIKAKKLPIFKVGKDLKEAVNDGRNEV